MGKDQADQLASAMVASAKRRVRVPPLSASRNREPLYRIDGYALYGDEEAAMAQKLATFAQTALGSGAGVPVEVRRRSQRSPWYISAFLSPDLGV